MSKDFKEVRELAIQLSGRRSFWTDGTVSAKAVRWECAWHGSGTARRPVWLKSSGRGAGDAEDRIAEGLEASVGKITFTLSAMGSLGRISSYVVRGSSWAP